VRANISTAATLAAACAGAILAVIPARADGPMPREFEGYIERVDAAAGTITLVREHAGRKTRLMLTTSQGATVFDCDGPAAPSSAVSKGAGVSIFLDSSGARDIAGLVVIVK
jgi:hypothetical protein